MKQAAAPERKRKLEMQKMSWDSLAAKSVAKKYFNFVQFTDGVDDKYGSCWQRMVMKAVKCDKEIEEDFWDGYAKKKAVEVIARRRQNVTGFMKKKFESKLMGMGAGVEMM